MISLLIYLRENAYGRENAIPGRRIARELGLRDDREVRSIVQRLRRSTDAPIGSTLKKPMGYFYIAREEDKKAAGWIERKGKSELYTAKHIRESLRDPAQLSLF